MLKDSFFKKKMIFSSFDNTITNYSYILLELKQKVQRINFDRTNVSRVKRTNLNKTQF